MEYHLRSAMGILVVIYGGSYNADVETGTMITLNNVRIDGDLYGGGYADSTNATANVTGGSYN